MKEQIEDFSNVIYDNELIKKNDWFSVTALTANYVMTDNDKFKFFHCSTGAATVTLTLPLIHERNIGRVVEIMKICAGGGKVTLIPNAADKINGGALGVGIDINVQWQGLRVRALFATQWIITDKLMST